MVMTSSYDLPDTIPVFPLPGALLLQRARLPLHLFEPRYLAMLDDVLKTPSRLIGMVQPYDAPGKGGKLHSIGCAGRVTAFSETEDGRYMITLAGISRFRITQEVEGFTPYRRCNVSWQGFERDLGPVERDQRDMWARTVYQDELRRRIFGHACTVSGVGSGATADRAPHRRPGLPSRRRRRIP